MALYSYRCGDDVETLSFPMGAQPKEVLIHGKRYRRSYADERPGVPQTLGWPMECVASGVHPSQANELREFLKRKGVPTDVTADGNPIYRDANHRRRALKARGFHDRAGYF